MPGKQGGGRLQTLLRQLDHTVGVNRFFVSLIVAGGKGAPRLVRWLSASEAAQRFTCGDVPHWLRPDGAGDVCWQGKVRRFYLEWDRGTTRWPEMVDKCRLYAAYYANLARTGVENGPDVLMVTTSPVRENIIWRTLTTAFVEANASPGHILTSVDPLVARMGPMAGVWRLAGSLARVCWKDTA
jgi:hypothetical protein